jgi:hypothetical protein
MRASANIAGVQWGKLLVNLNNALNALGDLPLRQQLAQRPWRGCSPTRWRRASRRSRRRASGRCRDAGPVRLDAALLRLPDAVFAMLLGSTMKIDPEARSSMWEDLQRRRRTEIDICKASSRHRRTARPGGPAIAARGRADQKRGGGQQRLARADAAADPAVSPSQLIDARIKELATGGARCSAGSVP